MSRVLQRRSAILAVIAASSDFRHGRAGSDAAISLEEGGAVPGTG